MELNIRNYTIHHFIIKIKACQVNQGLQFCISQTNCFYPRNVPCSFILNTKKTKQMNTKRKCLRFEKRWICLRYINYFFLFTQYYSYFYQIFFSRMSAEDRFRKSIYINLYNSTETHKLKSGCTIINIFVRFTTCGETKPISCRCQFSWTRLNESSDPQIIAVSKRCREFLDKKKNPLDNLYCEIWMVKVFENKMDVNFTLLFIFIKF